MPSAGSRDRPASRAEAPKPSTGSSSSPLAEACYRVRSFTGLKRLKVADYHLLPFSLGKDDAAMCEVLIARFLHPVQERPGSTLIEEFRFAGDSPLEGNGFELPVPRAISSVPRFRSGPLSVMSTDGSRR